MALRPSYSSKRDAQAPVELRTSKERPAARVKAEVATKSTVILDCQETDPQSSTPYSAVSGRKYSLQHNPLQTYSPGSCYRSHTAGQCDYEEYFSADLASG